MLNHPSVCNKRIKIALLAILSEMRNVCKSTSSPVS